MPSLNEIQNAEIRNANVTRLYHFIQNIPAGGIFLLGQEQDEVGRNFSMGEAFYGSMSQLNLWNKVLPENEIIELSRYRCPGIIGNELAWSDFLAKQVEIKKVTQFCNGKLILD